LIEHLKQEEVWALKEHSFLSAASVAASARLESPASIDGRIAVATARMPDIALHDPNYVRGNLVANVSSPDSKPIVTNQNSAVSEPVYWRDAYQGGIESAGINPARCAN
jgi:hypothetical protein